MIGQGTFGSRVGRVGCLNPLEGNRITGWLQRKSSLEGTVLQASHEQHVTSFPGSQDEKKPTVRCLLCSDRVLTEPVQLSGQTHCPLFLQSMAAFSGGRALWLLRDESETRSVSLRTAIRGGNTSLRGDREWEANHSLFGLGVFAQGC